ncbi:chitin synthase [Synchytrium endobioticum]|uniref:chitin synthase n=1 Tax=Synchytrium endobioticum TaxID=286115 RepID=A0A507DBT3_9FUNG|nr:chitin synthase [Synchytrium endobioticum]TPX54351.1 chitin synthase [Synchytrium endobioticum]
MAHAKRSSRTASNGAIAVDYSTINDLSGHILQDDIANIIHARNAQGQPYTFIGHDTLIAVQPSIQDHQTHSTTYAQPAVSNAVPTHLFELANRVHRHLVYDDEDQTIVMLGEAGSGKTVASRMLINQLFSLSTSSSRISNAIKPLNVILEAFSNDTTPTRRFGCYQEIQYAAGKICGLKLLSYNLNTTHLNFKIFHQLLSGATSEEKLEWNFTNEKYAYLPGYHSKDKSNASESGHLDKLRESLKAMKIGKSKQDLLFRLLAGILHLGNIEFVNNDEATDQNEACAIKYVHELDVTADLFGVSSKDLEFALTCKSRLVKNQVYTAYLDVATARRERDALAFTLYRLVFTYIVEKINTRLDTDEFDRFIGIIDFPGMVSPTVKSLQEMLVNYSQEQLLNAFRNCAVLQPASGLAAEGLPVPSLTPSQAHPLAAHVIPAINNESNAAKPSDTNIMNELASKKAGIIVSGSNSFIVQHCSSMNVDYQLGEFATCNVTSLSADHVALFTGDQSTISPSSNTIARFLFSDPSVVVKSRDDAVTDGVAAVNTLKRRPTKRNRSKPLTVKTFADEVVQGLKELLSILEESRPWFVACIAVHDGVVDSKTIDVQLLRHGILELVEARVEGSYPNSLPFIDFIGRYGTLLGIANDDKPIRAQCEHVAATLPQRSIFIGTTRVFLSESTWYDFEKKLEASLPKVEHFKAEATGYAESMTDASDYGDSDQPAKDDASQTYEKGRDIEAQYTVPAVLPSQMDADEKKEFIIEEEAKPRTTMSRRAWVCITWSLTWLVPSFILSCCGMKRPDVRMAWREKIALCIIIFFMCAAFLFFIIGLGRVICPRQPILTPQELTSHIDPKDVWISAYGRVYQINDLVKSHGSSYNVQNFQFANYLGQDVSYLFYKVPLWEMYCPGVPRPQTGWDNVVTRPTTSYAHDGLDSTGQPKLYLEYMNRYVKYRLGYSKDYIVQQANQQNRLLVIYDNVYDVSTYYNAANHPFGINGYAETIFNSKFGEDASLAWNEFRKVNATLANQQLNCMNNMFYIGAIDRRNDIVCQFSNYVLLGSSVLLMSVIGFKFLAALQCGSRQDPEDLDKFVIIQVPCYTEGPESLARTFESVAATRYDDKRKLMFVICDGMIIGSGNDRPTPQIVLDILGVDMSAQDPPAVAFESLGEGNRQLNYAKVYSGLYEFQGRSLPFVVVVKVGKPSERQKAGNRGKRDSQLVLMRFLSRVHFGAPLNPLEVEAYHHIKNIIGVNPSFYEFMLMVDADTEVYPDSLNRLVAYMQHDSKVMGLCGETLLTNEKDSVITMIQVYEYFISHHLAKQFESLFGSVTCLPGCFCMYRIRTPTKNIPLLISPALITEYAENRVETLHMKNLLLLGEDRYLTTLAMKHFPHMKLCFTPDAVCRTYAPSTWSVLKSQRRRWINSTVHNLVELVSLNQLCGFCCFSMRFVVFLDLFSTVLQPATILYVGYLIYSIAFTDSTFPVISIVLIGSIYGLQVIIFMLKQQWSQIIWMIIYILAMPIFTFYLPCYAFYRFDDFGWGSTRVVVGENGKKTTYSSDVEAFDKSSIPLTKWAEVEEDIGKRALEAKKKNAEVFDRLSGVGSIADTETVYAASSYGGSQYYVNGMPSNVLAHPTSYAGSIYSMAPAGQAQMRIIPQPQSPSIFGIGAVSVASSPSVITSLPPHHVQQQSTPVLRPPSQIFAPISRNSFDGDRPTSSPSTPKLVNSVNSSGTESPRHHSTTAFPSDSDIEKEVRNVLDASDLMTTSKKQVRKAVSQHLGVNLDNKKSFINEVIENYLIQKEQRN